MLISKYVLEIKGRCYCCYSLLLLGLGYSSQIHRSRLNDERNTGAPAPRRIIVLYDRGLTIKTAWAKHLKG